MARVEKDMLSGLAASPVSWESWEVGSPAKEASCLLVCEKTRLNCLLAATLDFPQPAFRADAIAFSLPQAPVTEQEFAIVAKHECMAGLFRKPARRVVLRNDECPQPPLVSSWSEGELEYIGSRVASGSE